MNTKLLEDFFDLCINQTLSCGSLNTRWYRVLVLHICNSFTDCTVLLERQLFLCISTAVGRSSSRRVCSGLFDLQFSSLLIHSNADFSSLELGSLFALDITFHPCQTCFSFRFGKFLTEFDDVGLRFPTLSLLTCTCLHKASGSTEQRLTESLGPLHTLQHRGHEFGVLKEVLRLLCFKIPQLLLRRVHRRFEHRVIGLTRFKDPGIYRCGTFDILCQLLRHSTHLRHRVVLGGDSAKASSTSGAGSASTSGASGGSRASRRRSRSGGETSGRARLADGARFRVFRTHVYRRTRPTRQSIQCHVEKRLLQICQL